MAAGWMIAVMVEPAEGGGAVRHFYAVAKPDQGRAEWAAVDCATAVGLVATSPVGGLEPVAAVAPLMPALVKQIGLADGQVRALGPRWPRRWLGPQGAGVVQE